MKLEEKVAHFANLKGLNINELVGFAEKQAEKEVLQVAGCKDMNRAMDVYGFRVCEAFRYAKESALSKMVRKYEVRNHCVLG